MEYHFLKLKADTPLPCGVCGRPVYDVTAFTMLRQGTEAQSWRITPLCVDHLREALDTSRMLEEQKAWKQAEAKE